MDTSNNYQNERFPPDDLQLTTNSEIVSQNSTFSKSDTMNPVSECAQKKLNPAVEEDLPKSTSLSQTRCITFKKIGKGESERIAIRERMLNPHETDPEKPHQLLKPLVCLRLINGKWTKLLISKDIREIYKHRCEKNSHTFTICPNGKLEIPEHLVEQVASFMDPNDYSSISPDIVSSEEYEESIAKFVEAIRVAVDNLNNQKQNEAIKTHKPQEPSRSNGLQPTKKNLPIYTHPFFPTEKITSLIAWSKIIMSQLEEKKKEREKEIELKHFNQKIELKNERILKKEIGARSIRRETESKENVVEKIQDQVVKTTVSNETVVENTELKKDLGFESYDARRDPVSILHKKRLRGEGE
jgi:hypothetical protein